MDDSFEEKIVAAVRSFAKAPTANQVFWSLPFSDRLRVSEFTFAVLGLMDAGRLTIRKHGFCERLVITEGM